MKNNKIIVSAIVGLFVALIIAATGWNFKVTAEIPAKYVDKEQYRCDQERMESKIDKIYDLLLDMKNGD